MARNCTVNSAGCVVCPSIPAVQAQPGRIEVTQVVGWNAGANSIDELDGDLLLRFCVGQSQALVVGLREARRGRLGQAAVAAIARGWYIRTPPGGQGLVAQVMEYGTARTGLEPVDACAVFEIRRQADTVTYRVDGVVKRTVRNTTNVANATDLRGGAFVTACLYASGDAVAPPACPLP